MDAIAALHSQTVSLQEAFRVVSTLNLLSYLYPQQQPLTQCPQEYDAIVVGAGSAGCVIAARLADAQFDVLLIEAGDDPPIETTFPGVYSNIIRSYLDWNYTNYEPESDKYDNHENTIVLSRGKTIGGTGSINGMLYVRGNPHDYDTWADIVNDAAWSWEEVLPYFKKSENMLDMDVINSRFGIYHGTDGPMKVTKQIHKEMNIYLEAFEELGYPTLQDTNSNESIGYGHPMFNIAEGRRWSSAYAFLPKMKGNPYFHIMKNTLVTRVTFDDSGKANGVEAKTQDGQTITLKASKEVILSAGVFNSPQILMLSGIGPKEHLKSHKIKVRADLPVGQNLQDHLGIFLTLSLDRSKSPKLVPLPTTNFPAYTVVGYAALNKSQTYPDYQTIIIRYPDDKNTVISFCSWFFDLKNEACLQLYEVARNRTLVNIIFAAFNMKSRGQVTLNSTDPSILPTVSLGWFNNEEDINTAASYIENFIQVINTTYFKNVDAQVVKIDLPACKDVPKGTREYWKCYVRLMWFTELHYVGTCALGSVVQSDLQVIGVPGLRVADASVMPVISSGNTNAPTVMIGEKLAQIFIDNYSE